MMPDFGEESVPGRELLEGEGGNAIPEACLTHPAICSH